jgi:hypothetical protein
MKTIPSWRRTLGWALLLTLGACGGGDPDAGPNQLPTVSGVAIAPAAPGTGDDLVVTAIPADPDGDTVALIYQWSVDGAVVPAQTTNTVPGSEVDRGEVWAVTVTPNDGAVDGAPGSATVTIGNGLPVAGTVQISPDPATVGSTLAAQVSGTADPDGDAVTLSYAWFVNDVQVATTDTLAGAFVRDDSVRVEVTANDGTTSGVASTAQLVISNSAPMVTGVTISPDPADVTTELSALHSSSDADGDSHTFSHVWYVNDVQVATSDTLATGFVRGDEVRVEVAADDGTSVGTAASSPAITIGNAPPTATLSLPTDPLAGTDDVVCVVASTNDPDGDTVVVTSITWTDDGNAFAGAVSTTTHAGDTIAASETMGLHTYACTVNLDDGQGATAQASAQVQVQAPDLVVSADMTLSAGSYAFADVIVEAGVTLFIDGVVEIRALSFVVDGTVNGQGRGFAFVATSSGQGPGAGTISATANSGAGGGGHGGMGGGGGYDAGDTAGVGGAAYGDPTSMSVDAGSSGGSSDNTTGGSGGAALWVEAADIQISGTIDVDGDDAALPGGSRGGGGGAGGGILLIGGTVSLTGTLSASGGVGSVGTASANDSGGGGAGGRIKVFHQGAITSSATTTVLGGIGGPYGGAAPGGNGGDGSLHIEQLP